jgi:hypothetical protein
MPNLSEPTSGLDWRRLFEQRTVEAARQFAEEDAAALGHRLRMENNINPRTDCWTCHR